MASVVVAAFYKFVELPDFAALQLPIENVCRSHKVEGNILLADEGINATVAGSREGIDALLAFLRSLPPFADLEHKESLCERKPFHRLKVRLKKEIVTIGDKAISPTKGVGTYVPPSQWNELLADPEVLLVDTRNDYETRLGTFENAIDPHIENFTDFPAWVRRNLDPARHKKVAMFCTGGIRCEKASAFMLQEGFAQVFHLQGGILKYLEDVPEDYSKWQGECFVFDHRVSVDHTLAPGHFTLCYGCQQPLSAADKQDPRFEQGVCCGFCRDGLSEDVMQSRRERARQVELAKARGQRHIGDGALPLPRRP
ncbi:MAG: rhodanese-related sulfurtransferase [Deltaproteobacteria bacterium]|nr:rhodanese-related sulfurtransferase [Deltaproteobacteria bacterium]